MSASADGNLAASADEDGKVLLCHLASGRVVLTLTLTLTLTLIRYCCGTSLAAVSCTASPRRRRSRSSPSMGAACCSPPQARPAPYPSPLWPLTPNPQPLTHNP